jgi:hypothetical protein
MSKNINRWGVGLFLVIAMLVGGYNVLIYKEGHASDGAFVTDKTDRMLIKEVLVNQQETLTLLKEIKAALDAAK